MAVYLFILLTLSLIVNFVKSLSAKDLFMRIGLFVGTILVLPPYIWYGWYSGLLF